jgi:sucrose-6-phosphate hydrolase SacC (GH32 family)
MANATLLASDNFASGSLAAGWSAWPTLSVCQVTSAPHYAEPNVANTGAGQLWTGLAWPADQISEATIQTLNSTGGNTLALGVRFTSTQGYQANILHGAGQTLTVFAWNAGSPTQIGSTVSGLTISSGDVWALAAQGSCISVYQNGKRIFYIGDATTASGGSPGFQLLAGSTGPVTNAQVSSWRGYSSVQQDGIWTKQGVIFPATAAQLASGGNFGTGVSGPQGVIFQGNAQILAGNVYKCWFTDAAINGVGYAESSDGITWTRYSSNPVISGYANGIIFYNAGTFYSWGQKTSELASGHPYMHTSSDGINWSAATLTNLPNGGTIPSVYYCAIADYVSGTFYMLIGALNGTNSTPNTYLATSTDGVTWAMQNSSNPVLANVFGLVQIVKLGTTYYMWGLANQPGQGNVTAAGFDPFETVLYSSTNLTSWTFVHHSLHSWGMWESLNSTQSGAYATAVLQMPTRVGMFYIASPGDSTAPQVYQGGLALGPLNSTIAGIVATNEDATTQIATDTFPGSSLSANWTTPTGLQAIAVGGGVAKASTANGNACIAAYTGASFTANQYSEVTITTLSGTVGTNFLGVNVRQLTTGKTMYQLQFSCPTGTQETGSLAIYRQISGVSITLWTSGKLTFQVGDVVRLSVVDGSDGFPVLTATQNGFTIAQVQDQNANPLTTGSPALQINAATQANATTALWAGGNTNVIPTFPSLGSGLVFAGGDNDDEEDDF